MGRELTKALARERSAFREWAQYRKRLGPHHAPSAKLLRLGEALAKAREEVSALLRASATKPEPEEPTK